MNNNTISRRRFVKTSALLAASTVVFPVLASTKHVVYNTGTKGVPIGWLESNKNKNIQGVTWGVPWSKGVIKGKTQFELHDEKDQSYALQSWPLAYWPDGSVKWSAHAVNKEVKPVGVLWLKPGTSVKSAKTIRLTETADDVLIDTQLIKCTLSKKGKTIISSIIKEGTEQVKNGKLVLITQDHADSDTEVMLVKTHFEGEISSLTVEQNGPVRAVIKIQGHHTSESFTSLIPFILRLYFYAGSDSIKIIHTIVYDGDENKIFIKGLGFMFDVNLQGELHNRHVRFVGEDGGIFAEAVRGLTGLRRDPGTEITTDQLQGKETPPVSAFPEMVSKRLHLIPAFGDYTLFQGSPDAFSIRKRTTNGHSWLNSSYGKRSAGTGYLGTPSGGLAFGIRNFWQSYPAQLDIRNAQTSVGEVTLWLWAPDSPAMDLRFYHDGMGMDDYDKQNEGLEITYEDYEPGFSTPYGVARTSELYISVLSGTPSNEKLAALAASIQNPPVLICDADYLQKQQVFGGNWSLPDRSSAAKTAIENQLDWYFDFYTKQVEQYHWYGFWNFGDVMHSYDTERHTWKYDVGGFAWDNSELSTDLWLWYYFLRTGRADVFHMAEAMTRHTGEVDVHHIGRFAPLGSRHNVMHWGCSAKQMRISTALNRRFMYYLTADERIGDLLHEQVDAVKTLVTIKPLRKREKIDVESLIPRPDHVVQASFGTDWGAIAAAWLTEWERTDNPAVKNKLINSMQTIAAQPKKFFTGGGYFDFNTGKFEITKKQTITVSHLNAVFGLTEVCEELILLLDVPEFAEAWLQYCRLYNASETDQQKELGSSIGKTNLRQGHSRLTAFAARSLKDKKMALRAWQEFYGDKQSTDHKMPELQLISRPAVLNPLLEFNTAGTNGTAQWGLSAIQCLAYIGSELTD